MGAYGFGEQEFEQLRRAREELRRLLGSLEDETPESLSAAVERAEGLLGQVISAAAPESEAGVQWVGPGFSHEAIAEAHLAIVTALQRLDGELAAGLEPAGQPEVDELTGAGRPGWLRATGHRAVAVDRDERQLLAARRRGRSLPGAESAARASAR